MYIRDVTNTTILFTFYLHYIIFIMCGVTPPEFEVQILPSGFAHGPAMDWNPIHGVSSLWSWIQGWAPGLPTPCAG